MTTTRAALAALALAGVAAISACGSQAMTEASVPAAPQQATSSSSTSAPAAVKPSTPTSKVYPFGRTLTADGRYSVLVEGPTAHASQSSLYAGPATSFKVTVKNLSDSAPLNLGIAGGSAMHNDAAAKSLFDSAGGIEGAPSAALRPGKSVTWLIGFQGAPTGTWDLDFSVDYSAKAMFSTDAK